MYTHIAKSLNYATISTYKQDLVEAGEEVFLVDAGISAIVVSSATPAISVTIRILLAESTD